MQFLSHYIISADLYINLARVNIASARLYIGLADLYIDDFTEKTSDLTRPGGLFGCFRNG